jgi:hypothetical protein
VSVGLWLRKLPGSTVSRGIGYSHPSVPLCSSGHVEVGLNRFRPHSFLSNIFTSQLAITSAPGANLPDNQPSPPLKKVWILTVVSLLLQSYVQGDSNMTGPDLCVNKPQSVRSYLNHLVYTAYINIILNVNCIIACIYDSNHRSEIHAACLDYMTT